MRLAFLGAVTLAGIVALVISACGGSEATATPRPTPTQPLATSQPRPTALPSTATPAAQASATQPSTAPPTATVGLLATPRPAPTATAVPPTPTASGSEPKTGGVLNARWYRDFRSWDTWEASGGTSNGFTQSLMSSVIKYQAGTFNIVGDLAEKWDVTNQGKTYTFQLRKDAVWHDGKPVTARDVLATFQRGQDPKYTQNKPRLAPIFSMEASDDYTFRVTIKEASNAFLAGIATPYMLIYPSHVPDMAAWHKAPLGSGPFKFKEDKPDSQYSFDKNPRFYGKDARGRQTPYLDGLNLFVISDPQAAESAFRSGRLHCGCIFAETWIIDHEDQLKKDIAGLKIEKHLGVRLQMYFNTKRAPFNSTAFRQGVAIGLDKDGISAAFQSGKTYRPAPTLIPPELGGQWGLPKTELQKMRGYNANNTADVEIARQKFKEAGLDPKGMKIEVFLAGATFQQPAEAVASFLNTQFGINATVSVSTSLVEANQRLDNGNFQFYLMSIGGAVDDPLDWWTTFLTTGGAQNWGGWSNPQFDQLMLAQDKEFDQAKRKDLIWQMQRIEYTEFPSFGVMWPEARRATRPEVNNFKVGPLTVQTFDFSQVWLEK